MFKPLCAIDCWWLRWMLDFIGLYFDVALRQHVIMQGVNSICQHNPTWIRIVKIIDGMVLVICSHDCMVVWNNRNAKIMAGQIVGFSTAAECLPDKSYFDRSVPCKLSSMLQNRDLNVLACWTWNCWGWLTCKIFGGVSPMQLCTTS